MKKSKRVISLLLSVIMLVSVFQTGFVAFAADSTQYVIDPSEAKQLADAGAVTEATQVVRVAETLYSYNLGTTIVPATPSGIPANDNRGLANAGNVNEIAAYPTVKITFKDLPSDVPQITCVNSNSAVSNVNMSGAVYNQDEQSYTWQIASGTANAGDTLKFKITYTYNGRQYTSYAYSYVENIAMPAGNAVTTESKYESGLFGWGTKYYAGVSAATRVLGINTYGSLESFTGGSSDLRGYYDATTNTFVTRSGADYATYNVMRSQSTQNENEPLIYVINDRRAYADVYVDTSVTKSFADLNLRFAVAKVEKVGGNETQSLDNVVVKQGNVAADSDLAGTGNYDLGTDPRTGVMSNGDQYVTTFTGQTITNGAEYTIITKLSSSYSGAKNETFIPVGLRVHTVDKGQLRALINDILHNNTPETPSLTDANKGVNPQSWYYSAGFPAYEKAMLDAQTVLQNPRSSQSDINNAISSLTNAYNGLVLAEADYSKVEKAIDEANKYEADKNLYTDDSYDALMQAISIYDADTNPDGKIQYGFSVLYQAQVDEWEAEIYDAIEDLEYRLADYTVLDEVYAEALRVIENEDMYVDISAVNIAIKSVKFDIISTEQYKVDEMVELLREAIDSLTYVKANYDGVNEALEKVKMYSSSNYTPESYANLRSVISSIDYDLDVSQQDIVNGYVDLIEQAIADLDELPADYTELIAVLGQVDALVEEYYYPDTYQAVMDVAAECRNYEEIGVTRQGEIDDMVISLKAALSGLVMYDADYSVVDAYIDEFYKLDHTQISQSSLDRVNNAINAVNRNLKVDRQSDVDDYALAIRVSIDSLAYNSADYTQVTLAVEKANKVVRANYTADSIAELDAALAGVQYGLGVNRQGDVDAMANAINAAIANLRPGPADYTRVNQSIDRYLAMNPDYYTPASVAKVQAIIESIDWNLTRDDQYIVNDYATQISFALLDLVEATADYSELNAIIDSIPDDLEKQYTPESIAALNVVQASIKWDLNKRDQETVVGYQIALTEAIQNLKYLTGDYTDVDKAIAEGRAIIAENDPPISADSIAEFEELVASLNRTYTIKQQAEIAALAAQVRLAYAQFSHAESIHKASVSLVADRTTSYPGDIITVSVIVGTDYYAAASSFPVLYDANYFELVGSTVSEAFTFEGSYAAASVTGGNIKSPAKGYPESYDEQDRAQWKYALVSFAPSAKLNPQAQILDPAQTVVKLQFRVLPSYTAASYKARIWIDEAFLKTDDNTTGKLYIGRYESEVVNNDVVTVGQDIDLTNATVGVGIVDPSNPAVFEQLRLALMKEPQYNKSFYTEDSYNAYADAVAVGEEVLTHVGEYTVKEQPIVDAATEAILNAYDALELLPADTIPLEDAIAEYVPVLPMRPGTEEPYEDPADVYTADTLKAYDDAYKAGKAILDETGLTVADNARIKAAADNIKTTFDKLTYKPFAHEVLMNASLDSYVLQGDQRPEHYKDDTYEAYINAYNALVEFKASNPTFLDNDRGSTLIYDLNQAYRNLELKDADLAALIEAINAPVLDEYGNSYPAEFYVEEMYAIYQQAIDEGNAILNADPPVTILDQERVDNATLAIQTAAADLMYAFKPSEVEMEYADAYGWAFLEYSDEYYTPESLDRYRAAEGEFYSFYPVDIRDDAEARRILDNLIFAYNNMEFMPADTTELEKALALENKVGDPSLYGESEYQAFMDAIEAAKNAYAEYNNFFGISEQYLVDELALAINLAYDALEVLPFSKLPELEAAIENKAEYAAEVYEVNAYAEYLEALAVIEGMIANAADLTISDDAAALQAIDRYNAALAALNDAILDADYSVVYELIEEANKYLSNEDIYENIDALKNAINAVDYDLKAYDQYIVTGYETAISEALANVVEKPGDYTAVDNAILAANKKLEEYQATGVDIIPETLAALENAIAAVEKNLTITKQDVIDAYAVAIEKATEELEYVSTVRITADSKLYLEEIGEYTYIRGFNPYFGVSESTIRNELEEYGDNTRVVVVPVAVVGGANWYGTGTRVQHYDGDVLVKEYYIVVDGDINGDGVADTIDVTAMIEHINEFTEPGMDENYDVVNPWFNVASDLCKDGVIDIIDLTVMISIVNYDDMDLYA